MKPSAEAVVKLISVHECRAGRLSFRQAKPAAIAIGLPEEGYARTVNRARRRQRIHYIATAAEARLPASRRR